MPIIDPLFECWLSSDNHNYWSIGYRDPPPPYIQHEGRCFKEGPIFRHQDKEDVIVILYREVPEDQEFVDAANKFEQILHRPCI